MSKKSKPIQEIKIVVSPDSFPRTREKLQELMDAISEEAKAHVEAQKLPPVAMVPIINSLLHQMIGTLSLEQQRIQEFSQGRIEEVHAYQTPDGEIHPFATGPEMTPLHNPSKKAH